MTEDQKENQISAENIYKLVKESYPGFNVTHEFHVRGPLPDFKKLHAPSPRWAMVNDHFELKLEKDDFYVWICHTFEWGKPDINVIMRDIERELNK